MFYLKGKIVSRVDKYVVVETNNIAYKVFINENGLLCDFEPIYIYNFLQDQRSVYYGFLSENELDVFSILLDVNGIGPKTALKILSSVSYENLISHCINDDYQKMDQIPSINAENCSSIMLKIKKFFISKNYEISNIVQTKSELFRILRSLGFNEKLYSKISFLDKQNITLKEKLSSALRILNEY